MDDLLDLFEEEYETSKSDEQLRKQKKQRSSTITNNAFEQENVVSPESHHHQQSEYPSNEESGRLKSSISVDERIGIRMINRKICGSDLLSMICENTFFSPAQLSSMSLSSLNTRILADPAAIVDVANVMGRTNIMTVGLVFSNSGTRVSSSGSAFCIVQIGSNLQTGPTVSIMLFGQSYSTYCRSITPGKVIAVFNPRLLPLKSENKSFKGKVDYTSISFTVNDIEQINLVADSRDYGICMGKVSSKNENGQWVSNNKRCCQVIDKSFSEYCQIHRRQQVSNQTSSNKTVGLDRIRDETRAYHSSHGLKSSTICSQNILPQHRQQTVMEQLSVQLNVNKSNPLAMNKNSNNLLLNKTSKNSLLNPVRSTGETKMNNPYTLIQQNLKPRIQAGVNVNVSTRAHTMPSMLRNAIPKSGEGSFIDLRTKRLKPINDIINGGMIPRKQARLQTPIISSRINNPILKKRRVSVNTDTNEFNGSVMVPKAAKIFGTKTNLQCVILPSKEKIFQRQEEAKIAKSNEAIARQKTLANQIKQIQQNPANKVGVNKHPSSSKPITGSREDLLFGALGDIDLSKIASATSKFSSEADAEDYARRRRVVADLEVEEEKKEFNQNNKTQKSASGPIQKVYHCKTCKRSFPSNPVACIRLKHNVSTERKIEETKTTAELRQSLTDKKTEDGGLKLGAGIEWTNWSRFS